MSESETQQARSAINAFRLIHDEMATFVQGLSDSDLAVQSAASEWTIAAVLSHMGSGAEIALGTLTTGKPSPDGAPAIWDRWNAMSPTEQASNFVASQERLVAALEGLDAVELGERKIDVGFLPEPISVSFFTAMRLGEVGLHFWDAKVPFDPSATVFPAVVPFSLVSLAQFLPFFCKPAGAFDTVTFTLSHPERVYALELRGDSSSLEAGDSAEADTNVFLPAEAFLRLASGRLAPKYTPLEVRVTGTLTLDDLRAKFPGY